jgi:hypothetical protein
MRGTPSDWYQATSAAPPAFTATRGWFANRMFGEITPSAPPRRSHALAPPLPTRAATETPQPPPVGWHHARSHSPVGDTVTAGSIAPGATLAVGSRQTPARSRSLT